MNERDLSIDIFKGFLVIGMIICHCMQFFSDMELYPVSSIVVNLLNIITFPGFVFAFGYTSYLAYFNNGRGDARKRILKNAFKTLMAFYISGIFYRILIDKKTLNISTILPIITLFDIPGWSEFLVSFAFFSLVTAIFYYPLKQLINNENILILISILLLLTSFISYERVTIPQIGLLIGTTEFASFPMVQHMPFYLMGIYFSKRSIGYNRNVLIISLVLTMSTVISILISGSLPERFPPSLLWLIAPCFILYLYFILSKFLGKDCKPNFIILIGENTLFYLLLSNILIFTLAGTGVVPLLSSFESVLMAMLLVLICAYLISITRKMPLKKK